MVYELLKGWLFTAGILGIATAVKHALLPHRKGYLAAWLATLSISVLYYFYSLCDSNHEIIPILSGSILYLNVVVCYLWIKQLQSSKIITRASHWLHFIPWGTFTIYSLLEGTNQFLLAAIACVVCLFYTHTQNFILFSNKKVFGRSFALKAFSLGMQVVYLLLFVKLASKPSQIDVLLIMQISMALLLTVAATPAYLHASFNGWHLFFSDKDNDQDNDQDHEPTSQVRKLEPLLSAEQLRSYAETMNQVMHEGQPYLQEKFLLADLSKLTQIPVSHISYVMNKHYNIRFQDFVNQYRIDHLAYRINKKDREGLTLDGLAAKAGFNSRTTLFRACIKYTGMSPRAYFSANKTKEAPLKNPA